MSLFLRDLLHDLREKRLWPVAAVLLLATVAVPVVLLRSSSGDASTPPPAAGAPPAKTAVALAEDEDPDASGLEEFDAKNPFEPRGPAAPSPPAEGEVPGPADAGQAGDGATPAGSDTGSTGGSTDAPQTDGGGDSGEGDGERTETAYAYAVDVRFGRRGGTIRTYRKLQRLDVLPRNGDLPVLVFLGVSPTGKTAIFLLDSSVSQDGDGRCKPSRDECTFLHLTTEAGHDLHYLETESGDRYAIRLLEIRRERIEAGSSARTSSKRARSSRAAKARARRTVLGADLIVYGTSE